MTQSLDQILEDWRFFEECLLHDVRPIHFGFGLDLTINLVWGDKGVRPDVEEAPRLVTLRLLGIESLCFIGGLTDAMRSSPEDINWGLTEIARVVSVPRSSGLALVVEWEGDRRLEVEFSSVEVLVSDADARSSPWSPGVKTED